MAAKKTEKKPTGMTYEQRQKRRQQIIFGIMSVMIILIWVLTLVIK
jgi:hypothetical protein